MAPMINPTKDIHFWLLMFPHLACQKPMNHAAGMDIRVDPSEYGREAIPAASGDIPSTA